MRYYDLKITKSDGSIFKEYTSLLSPGKTNPSALNIEFDIYVANLAQPTGLSLIRVWGISLQDMSLDFTNMNIQLMGGMQKGLPLANPAESGLLVTGSIFQFYTNWKELEQNISFVFSPPVGGTDSSSPAAFGADLNTTNSAPKNIILHWMAGTPLSNALRTTLSNAFPGYTLNINLNANLVLNWTQKGVYQTLPQLMNILNGISKSIIGGDYPGISISISGNTLNVFDGTSQTTPKNIAFTDLIGQPTWINFNTIQLQLVMRGDLTLSDFIMLPQTLTVNSQAALYNYRNNLALQGVFQIIQIRHVGNFRNPSANAWITVVDAITQASATGT